MSYDKQTITFYQGLNRWSIKRLQKFLGVDISVQCV